MVIMAVLASTGGGSAAEQKPETLAAFDKYIRLKEARLERPPAGGSFLWADAAPDRSRQLRDGAVLAQPASDQHEVKVPDGLIHDWVGAVFIPGATVDKTIALVQDYSNHRNVFQPEVIDSKILTRSGDDFKVYLRLKTKKVLTVVLNTEHDVHYIHLDRDRWQSRSYSTHIGEVENAANWTSMSWLRERITASFGACTPTGVFRNEMEGFMSNAKRFRSRATSRPVWAG